MTQSEASVSISAFTIDHEIEQHYQLVNSAQIFHKAYYRPTGYPILPIVQFLFLNATSNDMPAKTEKFF